MVREQMEMSQARNSLQYPAHQPAHYRAPARTTGQPAPQKPPDRQASPAHIGICASAPFTLAPLANDQQWLNRAFH